MLQVLINRKHWYISLHETFVKERKVAVSKRKNRSQSYIRGFRMSETSENNPWLHFSSKSWGGESVA